MCCRNSYPSFYISIFSTFQQDDHDKYIGAWIYFWSWVPLKRIYGSKKHVKLQRKIEKLCRCAFLVQLYTSERQALRCVFSSDYSSIFLNNYPSFYGGLTIWQAVSTFLCPFIESSLPVGQKESHSQESRKKKKSQELPISNLKSHPAHQISSLFSEKLPWRALPSHFGLHFCALSYWGSDVYEGWPKILWRTEYILWYK